VLGQVPSATRQIYVLSAGGLHETNPEYLRRFLGVSAEIVRVVDIDWNCTEAGDLVAFHHSTAADGLVSMTVTLPACANFRFSSGPIDSTTFANGHLYRNDTISYDLPEAYPTKPRKWWEPALHVGRTMTVHVRPIGRARFIIQHGGPNGLAWFDAP
jgi:hypothetical protein